MSVYSKLWVRNKPGDEMIDKYNTSSHHGAGEISDIGKSIDYVVVICSYFLYYFIMQKLLVLVCLVLAMQSSNKMLQSLSLHPRYTSSQKTTSSLQRTPKIMVSK